jgi:ABC-type multidrug transport system ATPase subunit/pSer/pThr/pTyr-binding forkhead associated (FHA) protein
MNAGATGGRSLEVRVDSRRWVVPAGESLTIGRNGDVDVRIDDTHISRRHAVLEWTPMGWLLTDHSRNGIFVNGRPRDKVVIREPIVVRFGGSMEGVEVSLALIDEHSTALAAGSALTHARVTGERQVTSARLRVGRSPDNDVVLDDLLVSRYHAELHQIEGQWQIVDLSSANGTYVHGHRISQATTVGPDSVIGIGRSLLQLVGDRLVTYVDTGDVGFEARDLVVTTQRGKRLLDGISFTLEARSLLAVVGPSGSGKSTLLRALTGFRPADAGVVRYGGRDLYSNYDELRQRIGLVPQDDILHTQLSVRRALSFAARLRFPAEVPRAERKQRIGEVLTELNLTGQARQRIDTLSGGQRKRTSVALELLTRPSLLFLDEPTSGLDPGLDKSVMRTLRGLADDGRTVVVVTHSVANLDVCDRLLILAPGGRLAFYGPPGEALRYFGQTDMAEVFILLEREPETDWAGRFRQSPLYERYVGTGLARPLAPPSAPGVGPRQQAASTQLGVLCQRLLAVIAADRFFAFSLLLLPLVLSLLAHAVPVGTSLGSFLLVLIFGSAFLGSASSVRELVKERAIYQRERAIGLSLRAYLGSKLIVLGVIAGGEAVVFALLGMLDRGGLDKSVLLGSGRAEIVTAAVMVAFASMVIGLVISAGIRNADRGMPLLVVVVMVQLILSGALIPVSKRAVLEQLSWLVPAQWGHAMVVSTINPAGPVDTALWRHDQLIWVADAGALAGLAFALVMITGWLLRRLDPQRVRV